MRDEGLPGPIFPVQGAVLHRLPRVGGVHPLRPVQVGDGAGHLQHPAIAPGGKAKALKSPLQQLVRLPGGVAHLPQLGGGNVRVAGIAQALETLHLKAAGGVRTLETALRLIDLGVSRIGSTASVAIVEELKAKII